MTQKHSVPSQLEEFIAIFAGAIGFTLLFMFALSGFVNMLFERPGDHAAGTHMASGDDHKPVVKKPPVKETEKPPVETVSFGQLLAQANSKKGAKVAKKCLACHSFDKGGKNKVGPNLYAVIGKKIGTQKGFKYSPALASYGTKTGNWEYNNLIAFLLKPKKLVPKTKMAFAGIKKNTDMANLIAYLRVNADQPVPLPKY